MRDSEDPSGTRLRWCLVKVLKVLTSLCVDMLQHSRPAKDWRKFDVHWYKVVVGEAEGIYNLGGILPFLALKYSLTHLLPPTGIEKA